MNSWQIIQSECNRLFKFAPSNNQLRLWFYGQTIGYSDAKKQHRAKAENLLGNWDMIIRLALRYTKKIIIKSEHRWSNEEISKFVYTLIWSELVEYKKIIKKNGTIFQGATFWTYALENKNKVQQHFSKIGAQKMKQALKALLRSLEK